MNLFGTDLPLVAAPMAGGVSTPELAAAVSSAGGFAFLPAGYRTAGAVAADLSDLRHRGVPVGINLFLAAPDPLSTNAFLAYRDSLTAEAEELEVTLDSAAITDDDDCRRDKFDVLIADPVPFISTTFGLPTASELAAVHRVGTRVLATVTTVEEARAAIDLGVDGLIAQGTDAGGHSGAFDPRRPVIPVDTADLVRAVGARTTLPILAAGGIDGPGRVVELLRAGAAAAVVGTLLLRTDESGASRIHRDALADPRFSTTVITHAFTGRPARALRNAFVERHHDEAPFGYPAIHHLTRQLRTAAARAGRADLVHLWAGTGFRHARTGPAGAVVAELARDL